MVHEHIFRPEYVYQLKPKESNCIVFLHISDGLFDFYFTRTCHSMEAENRPNSKLLVALGFRQRNLYFP